VLLASQPASTCRPNQPSWESVRALVAAREERQQPPRGTLEHGPVGHPAVRRTLALSARATRERTLALRRRDACATGGRAFVDSRNCRRSWGRESCDRTDASGRRRRRSRGCLCPRAVTRRARSGLQARASAKCSLATHGVVRQRSPNLALRAVFVDPSRVRRRRRPNSDVLTRRSRRSLRHRW
jgi:hypothetical protein